MASSMTRREFLKVSAAGSLLSPVYGAHVRASENNALRRHYEPKRFGHPKVGKYQVYFGDLHNHSEVGYARGSLERAFEIAREHLDFFAFTPHGYWHDISTYENNIEKKWLDGFEVTKRRWPEVLEAVRKYDQPGKYVPMAGFEIREEARGDHDPPSPG